MPFLLSFAAILSCTSWFIYAILGMDPYIGVSTSFENISNESLDETHMNYELLVVVIGEFCYYADFNRCWVDFRNSAIGLIFQLL